MVDLLSSLPDPPPEFEAAHSPPTSCRGLWAVCQPWRQGGRHGWRSLFIRRDTVGGSGRHQGLRGRAGIGKHPRVGAAVVAKPKDARAGVIECEHIWDADPARTLVVRWTAARAQARAHLRCRMRASPLGAHRMNESGEVAPQCRAGAEDRKLRGRVRRSLRGGRGGPWA